MDEKQKVNPTKSDESFSTRTQSVENTGTVINEEPTPKTDAIDSPKSETVSGGRTISNENAPTETKIDTKSTTETRSRTEESKSNNEFKKSKTEPIQDSYNTTGVANQDDQKTSRGGLFWIIIIIILLIAVPKLVSDTDTSSKPDNNLSSLFNNNYNSSEEQKLQSPENNLGNSSQNDLSSQSGASVEDEKETPKKIIGNKISDSFKFKEQENIYSYTAPKSGRFIVYLDVNEANTDFDIKVISPSTAILKSINYVAAKYGKTRAEFAVYLTEGDTYIIKMTQDSALCNYTIEFVAQ